MKFPYRDFEVVPSPASKKKRIIYRPIIPVFLIYNKRLIGYQALIDSGSDHNIFDAIVAEILGVRITSGHKRQIRGIGAQKIKGYEHDITLKVANEQYRTKVIFSKQIPLNSFGVLGNQGFFNHFKVTFKYPKYIELI